MTSMIMTSPVYQYNCFYLLRVRLLILESWLFLLSFHPNAQSLLLFQTSLSTPIVHINPSSCAFIIRRSNNRFHKNTLYSSNSNQNDVNRNDNDDNMSHDDDHDDDKSNTVGDDNDSSIRNDDSMITTPLSTNVTEEEQFIRSNGKFATSTITIGNSFSSTSSVPSASISNNKDINDLTDRFKYKMNALLGLFDPIPGFDPDNSSIKSDDISTTSSIDTEQNMGNLYNAFLEFPLRYTFHVVGKVSSSMKPIAATIKNDDNSKSSSINNDPALEQYDSYIKFAKEIVYNITGDDEMMVTIQPRGQKYTKVSIEAVVQNTYMITTINQQLKDMELSVMQF